MTTWRTLRRPRIIAAAVFASLAIASIAFAGCTAEVQAELQTYSGINGIRQDAGLPPLTPDPALIELARARSRDMAANDYFSHSPPDGCNFICLMDRANVPYAYTGENIAWNTWNWKETAAVAVDMWYRSPPHMENILNCHYTRFGTGVAEGPGGKIYYTMLFEGNAAC